MKTKQFVCTNHEERAEAENMGLPVPEKELEWGTFWFDISNAIGAYENEGLDGSKGLTIIFDTGSEHMIPDTPENRALLDKRFA